MQRVNRKGALLTVELQVKTLSEHGLQESPLLVIGELLKAGDIRFIDLRLNVIPGGACPGWNVHQVLFERKVEDCAQKPD
jgi:hypothetical protein